MKHKILIVDDEEDILELLKVYLELNEYEVITAKNGSEAIKQSEKNPDIILLDVNMPDMDGFEVCRHIRNHVSCPILFLTAKVEDEDRIAGFTAGGDDYIVKPFQIDVLGARISAHLRREARNTEKNSQKKFFGPLTIDYTFRSVYNRDKIIPFTKKEYAIIEFLSMNQGQVFDKETIYERVWGLDSEGDSSVIAEHIRRIRAKLNRAGKENYIETVWGVGYRWNA